MLYTPKHNAQPAEEKFGFGDSPASVRKSAGSKKFKNTQPEATPLFPVE